ncbi:endonuclease/exonuclease/phosphatase family protein [Alloscardovia criceti]|uniref:endonuclease/exonuclease/phosphatase family protein n=1 Tax=Alloscardovia criceti TaxID=356828 RepID=UPI000524A464|nr:endonuclease/exonuclease/phosphatase family protein [Alloscardovia criceti]
MDDSYVNSYGDYPAYSPDTKRFRGLFALLWLATFGVIGVMILRIAPNELDGKKYIPLIVSFTPWFALVSAFILIIALLGRRKLLAVICLGCLVAQAYWHSGYVFAANSSVKGIPSAEALTVDTSDNYARLMTLNAHNGQADAEQIVSVVSSEHVEVLALQEVSNGLVQRLYASGLAQYLPYSVLSASSGQDNGGVNAIFTAAPMTSESYDLIPTDASSVAAACIGMAAKSVCFGSVHPFSPRPGQQGLWDSSLDSLSQLQSESQTYVLLGDFNATWDHKSFRELLGSRFLDAGQQTGEGFHMTYPSNKQLAGIDIPAMVEIDHIVYDRGLLVGDLQTVTISGSDHKALLGTLTSNQ